MHSSAGISFEVKSVEGKFISANLVSTGGDLSMRCKAVVSVSSPLALRRTNLLLISLYIAVGKNGRSSSIQRPILSCVFFFFVVVVVSFDVRIQITHALTLCSQLFFSSPSRRSTLRRQPVIRYPYTRSERERERIWTGREMYIDVMMVSVKPEAV